ncbi:electron transfer flavoprotein subunit alpha/FixB family protein [Glutamicibacter sp.]|uniref:electron transfer flavoprotein subunit alpha/FixB family protein n=1 Tax=Glutamicibacter sp. TaxID=1931995 RepID=UPI0028BDD9CA|nr:electron transfer flavoprotein subunit alpha/FixB family protein [Glutamicibacter sp.]
MSSALVFFSNLSTAPSKAQRELLTLAARFENPTVAAASLIADEAREVLGQYGIATALQAQNPNTDFGGHELAVLDAALQHTDADLVLLENDSFSREIGARIAVRRNTAIVTDVVDISADLIATKDELAGSYSASVKSTTGVLIATVKPNSVEDAPHGAQDGVSVKDLELAQSSGPSVSIVAVDQKVVSDRPALNEARIVVAGGRGVDGDFGPVEDLADALGAAIGASRAATDAGWISHDAQIGQTGVTVSPQLYISAGISGAIQQKAGMQTSKFIIAVNKDMDAPVFEIADLGIVGDLSKVLPQAAAEIRRRQA